MDEIFNFNNWINIYYVFDTVELKTFQIIHCLFIFSGCSKDIEAQNAQRKETVILTCATNGVSIQPIREIPEHDPKAMPRMCVG